MGAEVIFGNIRIVRDAKLVNGFRSKVVYDDKHEPLVGALKDITLHQEEAPDHPYVFVRLKYPVNIEVIFPDTDGEVIAHLGEGTLQDRVAYDIACDKARLYMYQELSMSDLFELVNFEIRASYNNGKEDCAAAIRDAIGVRGVCT